MIDLTPLISMIRDALHADSATLAYVVCLGALGVALYALHVALVALRRERK
ncbi:hypothetical protein [Agrilutibacter solisilvae]|uniref:DUF3149 domain-containing protein n=1 Tax=Agrilutibacter solisilvae TaxID=2763317 RepID=A0A975ARV8_9GAMM|nr:hypothetical protein [Lysobacter solisilvae]QSX78112.1 hypothetical protein I8J32_015655 [Lysobacter solisilvae]